MQLKVQYIFWLCDSQDVGQQGLVGVLFKVISQQWWITSSLKIVWYLSEILYCCFRFVLVGILVSNQFYIRVETSV